MSKMIRIKIVNNRLDCHSSNELRNDGTLGCQTPCHCEEQQPKTGDEAIHN